MAFGLVSVGLFPITLNGVLADTMHYRGFVSSADIHFYVAEQLEISFCQIDKITLFLATLILFLGILI